MGSKSTPDPGQLCGCSGHPLGQPSVDLRRVYYEKGERYCYEWWCEDCNEREEVGSREEGWPTGSDGRFLTPVHCPTIPGLD